ncbi:hypothetical protein [Roseimaritima ulvae]|uniref:Uncharacterized protein n=1 Tax=Roseimaritima ulvae TaxID=980254 RepID=A0A5B9QZY9_9BACT|nr:hypothetical protein [Roseimaritima ulvae]QEG43015.1 hypothetical protein UC8_50580 [Roseimaritima ulvae]
MGFLKRILRSTGPEGTPTADQADSFGQLSDEELQTHMGIDRYDAFDLTAAIRPSYDLQIIPRQGFRQDEYRDDASGAVVPVLMAAATRNVLMDLFLDLIDPLGPVVDVVLETSHHATGGHQDLYREHIDLPVLKSTLLDFEDILLNDGCTGIAIVNPQRQQEVQFDEHKMLIAYGTPLDEFERILIASDVYPDPKLRFVTEAEHVHSSNERYLGEFEMLKARLGIDSDWS